MQNPDRNVYQARLLLEPENLRHRVHLVHLVEPWRVRSTEVPMRVFVGVVHYLIDQSRRQIVLADGIAGRCFSGPQVEQYKGTAGLHGFQLPRDGFEKGRWSDGNVAKRIVIIVATIAIAFAHFGQRQLQFLLGILKLQRVRLFQLRALDAVGTQEHKAPGPGLLGGLGHVEGGAVIDGKGFPGGPVPRGQATDHHVDRAGFEQAIVVVVLTFTLGAARARFLVRYVEPFDGKRGFGIGCCCY
mmetsp:Transcript_8566/g.18456  ORF Transcript_8566/g.18456 Transcript_8566/m.18456 type:complete len:243 (+) Transcript_8566:574-1302(+)